MIDLVRIFLVANLFTLLPYADEVKVEQVEVEMIRNMYSSKDGDLMIEAQVTYSSGCYHPMTQQISVVDEEQTIFLYHFAEKEAGVCALGMFPTVVQFIIPARDLKNYRFRDGLTGRLLRERQTLLTRAM